MRGRGWSPYTWTTDKPTAGPSLPSQPSSDGRERASDTAELCRVFTGWIWKRRVKSTRLRRVSMLCPVPFPSSLGVGSPRAELNSKAFGYAILQTRPRHPTFPRAVCSLLKRSRVWRLERDFLEPTEDGRTDRSQTSHEVAPASAASESSEPPTC